MTLAPRSWPSRPGFAIRTLTGEDTPLGPDRVPVHQLDQHAASGAGMEERDHTGAGVAVGVGVSVLVGSGSGVAVGVGVSVLVGSGVGAGITVPTAAGVAVGNGIEGSSHAAMAMATAPNRTIQPASLNMSAFAPPCFRMIM